VLDVITPALANRLRGTTDSAALLHRLEEGEVFTIRIDERGTYRYHEVLRSHLEVLLTERDGAEAVRARHRHAGSKI
jgi:ATP/maltotriose-dependent transcriptional regulator MalT